MAGIELRSSSFTDGTLIADQHSLDGANLSPQLVWSGVPDGAAELALLCEDPDAPSGTFTHWLVTGIDPSVSSVAEGEEPPGTAARNGYGDTGYGGPQPPVGDDPHRYFFRIYAAREPLGLGPDSTREDLLAALDGKELASGTTYGLFGR